MTDKQQMFRLDGRVALVAGAGSGIGCAAAEGLAAAGATVICVDKNASGAEDVAGSIRGTGGSAAALAMDTPGGAGGGGRGERFWAPQGGIGVLFSTPAVNVRKGLLDYSGDEFDRVLQLNLRGTFNITQPVARIMRQQKR